ncbi:MAG: (d)CMP kinase [bacterium]
MAKTRFPSREGAVIAIDGPAGAGKSTVAKILALKLNYLYIDTGAMYRAVTLKALRQGVPLSDDSALARIAEESTIEFRWDRCGIRVLLDGEDVSEEIRTPLVSKYVSPLSALKSVRDVMVKRQREMAKSCEGAVMDGRDIGTVVFPDADVKIYLDATVEERAKRRWRELRQSLGESVNPDAVEREMRERDEGDMSRAVAPLRRAEDAIYLDTTELTIDEVVGEIYGIVLEKLRSRIAPP